eukprot:gnl/TRDRNA2_/TRDRNA2_186496_c0_seq1.p1 gnl/TRDRNA2_/TRDRNA2_186496_c0~~gnl/TRDRNA2_/TRDRNA2_186496_c0_seq1.p1  ORF type:complete len:213 (-),score=46.48 gnl/TRDRNA2_/TRDRNA2_186496_c0_seq1:104-742(-)
MLSLFKPNSYDPKDWQCPKPSCRTINFKKRTTCISCGARKPERPSGPLYDWREGEKEETPAWTCLVQTCLAFNKQGASFCMGCGGPSPVMMRMMEEEKREREKQEGRGGGLFDRQDPNDKKEWNSDDEEFDDFGRRKKKSKAANPSCGAADAGNGGEGPGESRSTVAKSTKETAKMSDRQRAALERLKGKVPKTTGLGKEQRRSRSRSGRRR